MNGEYCSGSTVGSRLATAKPVARSSHLSSCTRGTQAGHERTAALVVPARQPGPRASLSRRELLESGGALAGLAGCLLAACAPRQDRAPAAQAPATLAPAGLTVWVWWKDPVESLEQMAASFSQQHVAVTVSVDAPAGYWDKLQAALAGGVGPDLYFMNNVNYWSWINRDVLVDLTPLISRDGVMQKHLENAWQDAITFYKYKGRNYGLPYMYTTVVLYYNEDALRAAGLRTPAAVGEAFDWTLLREYAQKLTRREGNTVTMWGFQSTEGIETGWLNWVRANGGDFLNKESTRCIIDELPSVEAWQYLTDLRLTDQVSPDVETLRAEPSSRLFMSGKLAIWPGGSWNMKTLNAQLTAFRYDIALLPASPRTKQRGGTTNIVGVVLNKDGKAQTQSWEFMKHMLSKESQDLLARADVLAPVRNDSAQLYYDVRLGPANRTAAFQMQRWTRPLPTHEKVTWTDMLKPVGPWQSAIFEGRSGVKEGLTAMAAEVNALFAAAR